MPTWVTRELSDNLAFSLLSLSLNSPCSSVKTISDPSVTSRAAKLPSFEEKRNPTSLTSQQVHPGLWRCTKSSILRQQTPESSHFIDLALIIWSGKSETISGHMFYYFEKKREFILCLSLDIEVLRAHSQICPPHLRGKQYRRDLRWWFIVAIGDSRVNTGQKSTPYLHPLSTPKWLPRFQEL